MSSKRFPLAPRDVNLQSTDPCRTEPEGGSAPQLKGRGLAHRARKLIEMTASRENPSSLKQLQHDLSATESNVRGGRPASSTTGARIVKGAAGNPSGPAESARVMAPREEETGDTASAAAAAAFQRAAIDMLRSEAEAKLLEAYAALDRAARAVEVAEEAGHRLGELTETLAGLKVRAEQAKAVQVKPLEKAGRSKEDGVTSNRAVKLR